MGVSPLRLALAVAIGGVATGGLYVTQQAIGHPPAASAQVAPERPRAAVAPPTKPQPAARPSEARAAIPLKAAPRRIVFRHNAPGDVVLTVHGDVLQVEFLAAAPQAHPPKKPAPKAPVKLSAQLPHLATPVATP